jgi:hypothetical protein
LWLVITTLQDSYLLGAAGVRCGSCAGQLLQELNPLQSAATGGWEQTLPAPRPLTWRQCGLLIENLRDRYSTSSKNTLAHQIPGQNNTNHE